jgi:hypothetical protein
MPSEDKPGTFNAQGQFAGGGTNRDSGGNQGGNNNNNNNRPLNNRWQRDGRDQREEQVLTRFDHSFAMLSSMLLTRFNILCSRFRITFARVPFFGRRA